MARFPNMTPSSRTMTMGDLPSKVYRAMSGATVRRAFGNKKTQYVLKLQFKNIGDDNPLRTGAGTVAELLSHYDTASGTFDDFLLSKELFSGIGTTSKTYFKDADVKWRYAKPPEVTSIHPGVSSVSIELIGELNG